ncbi:MAG: hypothetical protein EA411_05535 [Saprospirales bacterium]|nr:MAG: hypothetical protein EA411_05535 [Saprospirales bacterium]
MRIILTTCLIFIFQNAYSQATVSDFTFGFEVSPVISWMSTDDNLINGNGANLGVKLGTTGEYMLSENYSITAAIHFSFNQGGQLFYESGGNLLPRTDLSDPDFDKDLPDNVDIRYKLQFLEIPFGFKMRTNQMGNIRYFAHFPEFGFFLNTQSRANVEGGSPGNTVNTKDENINDEVPFLRFRWGVSAGLEYNIGGDTFLVGGIGYQGTFGDILKGRGMRNNGQRDNSTVRIHGLVVKLGVLF